VAYTKGDFIMGFDLSGMNPITEEGEYFRNTVWWWHPLVNYILHVAPKEITSKCTYWHSNDGDGLDAANTASLATFLQTEIDSGRTKEFEICYKKMQEELAEEFCDLCNGTGKTGDMLCNMCDGKGKCKSWDAKYPFVQEFVTFLKESGGFVIW
jgi:hypothetical protein